jgi:regulator of protease activity HflC (stomatin/prohibitin superfamily)
MAWERVVHYRRGKFVDVLEPGRHRFWSFGHDFFPLDVRSQLVSVPPQEIATSDGVTVKVSATLRLRVVDPVANLEGSWDPTDAVYDSVKAALREIVRARTFDEVVAGIDVDETPADVLAVASTVGYEVEAFDIRDVIAPAEVRRAAEELVTTRQHAQIALEEARAQSAVLRHLANVAGILEDHPNLAAMRLAETAGQHGGSVIIERPARTHPTSQ